MVRQVNFSNEAQNRAAGTISASLYERKALDCTTSLPLIFSLNNLAYLVANNRKIRDLLCVDGGLERLIHILRDVPKNQGTLMRPRSPKDLQPMWKWTTAFQCVVHLCIRGGVNVRERAVEAGIMPILVKVLESYLCYSDALRQERKRQIEERRRTDGEAQSSQQAANDAASLRDRRSTITAMNAGTATAAATREHEREREQQDRQTQAREEQAAALFPSNFAGAAARAAAVVDDHENARPQPPAAASSRLLPAHQQTTPSSAPVARLSSTRQPQQGESSRSRQAAMQPLPVDMPTLGAGRPPVPVAAGPSRMDAIAVASAADAIRASSSRGADPALAATASSSRAAVAREAPRTTTPLMAARSSDDLRGEGSGSGTESGLEEAEMSGDGADAEDSESAAEAADESENGHGAVADVEERRTPRASRRVLAPLAARERRPPPPASPASSSGATPGPANDVPQAAAMSHRSDTWTQTEGAREQAQPGSSSSRSHHHHHHHHGRDRHSTVTHRTRPVLPTTYIAETFDPTDMAFREEEVLLSLQILAYLTKYSHIRALLRFPEMTRASNLYDLDVLWEKASTSPGTPMWQPGQQFHRSIYTIAERYTCRATKRDPNAEFVAGNAKLAPLIQYWAGVVMRNACRKDDREGDEHLGLRQCGNMLCGKWETEPREFAKCRRCKKAKFCSKVCQSTSWQIGHKYWCSSIAEDLENNSNGASNSGRARSSRSAGAAAAGGAAQPDEQHRDDDDDDDARPERHLAAAAAAAAAVGDETAMPQAFDTMTPTTATAGAGRHHEHVDENDAVVRARSATVRATHHPRHVHAHDEAGPAGHHHHGDATMAATPTTANPTYMVTAASPTTVRRLPSRRASTFNNRGGPSIPTRIVSEALSAAASDMSEDEGERSGAHAAPPSDGELSEANDGEGGHGGPSHAVPGGAGNAAPPAGLRGPPPAPMRTDIAGRPLPPPVIAGTGLEGFAGAQLGGGVALVGDGGGGLDDSFGGRFTPGVDEQFGRADIDQITWRGQTPTPDLPDDEDDEESEGGTGANRLARRRRGPHRRFFATPTTSDREETEGEEEDDARRRGGNEARTPISGHHHLPLPLSMRHASASGVPGTASSSSSPSGSTRGMSGGPGDNQHDAHSHLRVPVPQSIAARRFPMGLNTPPGGPRAVSSAGSLRPRSSNLSIMSDGPSTSSSTISPGSSSSSSPLNTRRAASGMLLASSSSHDFLIGGSEADTVVGSSQGSSSATSRGLTTPTNTLHHRQSEGEGLNHGYHYHGSGHGHQHQYSGPSRSSTGPGNVSGSSSGLATPGMLGRSSTPTGTSSSSASSSLMASMMNSSPLSTAHQHPSYGRSASGSGHEFATHAGAGASTMTNGGGWNDDQPTPQVERRDPMAMAMFNGNGGGGGSGGGVAGSSGSGSGGASGRGAGAEDVEMDLG